MKFRYTFVLTTIAFAFGLAPLAHAASFLDLPGMGTAQRAVPSASPAPAAPSQQSSNVRAPALPNSSVPKSPSTTTAQTLPLQSLPGAGVLPFLSGKLGAPSSSRSPLPSPDALLIVAAVGSFAALGALYTLRRIGRI